MVKFLKIILLCVVVLCLSRNNMVVEAGPSSNNLVDNHLGSGVREKGFNGNRVLDLNSDCCRPYILFNCTGTERFDRGVCLDCGKPDKMGFCGVGHCNREGCGCEGKCRRATDNPHAKHLEDQNPIYT